MTTNYLKTLLVAIIAMGLNFSTSAQCLDWVNPNATGGWTDFNATFGGAPCDDGTGCPLNEITTFEVIASEAYAIDNFVMGGTYAFSMCNGAGAGTWVPEFTIISPNGTVDAFGAGDGDGCTITFTCSESGTYLIVVNEAGSCGGGSNTGTNNGFPAITCTSSTETTCPVEVTACNAGDLQTTGTVAVCPGGTFDVQSINDTIPNSPTLGDYTWQFNDGLGGTGGLAGGFTITGSTNMETWDNDLSGILSANALPVLQGLWVVRGAVASDNADPTNTVCSVTMDSLIIDFSTLAITSVTDNGDMSATVVAEGGSTPYGYEWSDGQTTDVATNLMDATIYYVTVSDANGCEAVDSVLMGSVCFAGTLATTGVIDISCSGDTFDIATAADEALPLNAFYGWYFDNALGGTGALDAAFVLTNIDLPASDTYNNDLNGILSGNALPPFEGTWVVKGAVYEDAADPFNSICNFTGDSLTINFSADPLTGTVMDNNNLTATAAGVNGAPPYTYAWSDGQTTETATGLTDGQMISVIITDANGCTVELSLTIMQVICNPGTMTTTGAVTACDDEVIDVMNDGSQEIPDGGAYGWVFDNALGGTGGLNGAFILLNIADPSVTAYDRDLNGVLSANNFPVMEGTWTIQGAVYTDPADAFNTICNLTMESLIITFSEAPTASAADNGDGTATASASGGTTPYSYEWSDGQTSETAIDLTTGTYMVTVTEEFGCTSVASVDVTVASVDHITSLENIDISPNPTNGNFQVNLELNTAEVVSVEVLDVVGRSVQSITAGSITNEVFNIDLDNEAEGVYIVRLNIGDKVLMRRVVLNK